jgi:hypothetical protein
MRAALRTRIEEFLEEPKQWFYAVLAGLLLFWSLRGCLPGVNLPPELAEEIERGRIVCVTTDETAIWPGEPRQPECGRMVVDLVTEGIVPTTEKSKGITQAICYRITIENPRWETMGQTRHELIWAARSYSKVAVLQNGIWQTFPDEYIEDEQRWVDFGCPGEFASE